MIGLKKCLTAYVLIKYKIVNWYKIMLLSYAINSVLPILFTKPRYCIFIDTFVRYFDFKVCFIIKYLSNN